jgi:hypothetical protein
MIPLAPSIGSYVVSPFSPYEALASLYLLPRCCAQLGTSANYLLKLVLACLTDHISPLRINKPFDLGQGSTSASNIWCIMHGILIHTVPKYFVGIILVSVSGRIQHTNVGEGLIDDTGLAYSAQSSTEFFSTKIKDFPPDESILFDNMQKMLQFFLELIQVAGGDLNISKCACFTVFHIWCGGRSSLLKIKASHPLMTITHPHTGKIKNIVKKDPGQAHRALGWMMTTDGKSTAHFMVLKQRSKLFSGDILQSRMQRYDATSAYNCYNITIIGYTLVATRLSFNQCKTIQSPILSATLNKMGINRNVTRAIVFSPKHLGGMSLSHLHTLQDIRRL